MQLITPFFAVFISFITFVAANSVTFLTIDDRWREVCWYPQDASEGVPGYSHVAGTVLPPHSSIKVGLEEGWSGQFHTIYANQGRCEARTIVAEVKFQGAFGHTYYAISAIDNCCDNSGLHFFLPMNSWVPVSGCRTFPCDGSYNRPGDIQTKVTDDRDMIVVVGN